MRRCRLNVSMATALSIAMGSGCGDAESVGEATMCADRIAGEHSIAALLSYEGNMPIGPSLERAVTQAVDDINRNGGVAGGNLGLVLCSTRGEPSRTRAALSEVAKRPDVSAVIGPVENESALVAEAMAMRERIVLVTPVANSTALSETDSFDWVYRTAPTAKSIANVVSLSLQERGVTRLSVIVNRDDDCNAVWRELVIIETRRGRSPFVVEYDPLDEDFASSAISLAMTYQPNAIFLLGYEKDAVAILRRAVSAGVHLRDGWLFPPWLRSHAFVVDVGDLDVLEGSHGIGASYPQTAEGQAFTSEYVRNWASPPEAFDANAYDAVFAVALAMQIASDAGDRTAVRTAMAKLHSGTPARPSDWAAVSAASDKSAFDFTGATGSAVFSEGGDKQVVLEEWSITSGDFTTAGCWDPDTDSRCQ